MSVKFRLKEAGFAYPQEGLGLQPLSLTIERGEGLLVAGHSGSGKSTLARLLVGLIPHLYHGCLQGEVWLDDLLTAQTPLWELTRRAGLVFQNPASQMLTTSVEEEIIFGLENLGLSQREIQERTTEALRTFNLEPLRRRSPQTLSGGEQQKLALASILARRPPALVLDEPLSMLDSTSALDFVDTLNSGLQGGRTLVICEHRLEYLQAIKGLRTLHLNGQQTGAAENQPEMTAPLEDHRRHGLTGDHFQIQVHHLTVERGGQRILDNLEFTLHSGEVVALVGPNGAGKTTLLRALAGLQKAHGLISAVESGRAEPPSLGMVFQNPDIQLFNPTVREEILYRLPQPDLELYDWLMHILDLERYAGTPPLLLSEGEKRRVALATTLMRRPRHGVLLDEPSLGQDRNHKAILRQALRHLADSGQVVLMATHDLELASSADRMILLSKYGILEDGPAEAVMQNQAAWDRLGLRVPDWVVRG